MTLAQQKVYLIRGPTVVTVSYHMHSRSVPSLIITKSIIKRSGRFWPVQNPPGVLQNLIENNIVLSKSLISSIIKCPLRCRDNSSTTCDMVVHITIHTSSLVINSSGGRALCDIPFPAPLVSLDLFLDWVTREPGRLSANTLYIDPGDW